VSCGEQNDTRSRGTQVEKGEMGKQRALFPYEVIKMDPLRGGENIEKDVKEM
jgi:hypothetical protein